MKGDAIRAGGGTQVVIQCYVANSFAVRYLDSKVHGANMGPIWGQQDPGGPYVGPMNLAIWVHALLSCYKRLNLLLNTYMKANCRVFLKSDLY